MIKAQKCIILAGGKGSRIRSTLGDIPKCLAPIANSTFLEFQLSLLQKSGIEKFILSLGYGSEHVLSLFKTDQFNKFSIDFVVEPFPLGTGGAALFVMDYFNLDSAFVVNGDTYFNADYFSIYENFHSQPELARIALAFIPNRSRFGGVELDKNGVILNFQEKGQHAPGLINAGLYLLKKEIFSNYRVGESFSIENDIFLSHASKGLLRGIFLEGNFTDIGIPEDYKFFCHSVDKALNLS